MIVREKRPVEPEGVVKFQVENQKWVGLEDLDVGSKFLMFSTRIYLFLAAKTQLYKS